VGIAFGAARHNQLLKLLERIELGSRHRGG
jgi:hypothetical protein